MENLKIIYGPVGFKNVCALRFIPFFKKLRLEHRVVTSFLVGVVLWDCCNYILLTEADALEQE
jgi:hypothetical protein